MMAPRRGVRRAHQGGARHRVVGRRRRRTRSPRCRPAARSSCAASGFNYPGAEAPVLHRHHLHGPARPDHGDHRQHRLRQDHAAQPGRPAVRRHRRRRSWSTASTSATSTPSCSWSRIGLVPAEALPVLRHGRQQPALRPPDATDEELWEALEIAQARDFVGRMPGGLDARSPRAAPTCPAASASGSPSPGRWCASRASTCSTTRSRRSTSPPTPGCGPRWRRSMRRRHGGHRGPAGVDHRRRRPDPRARGRRQRRPRHARRAAGELSRPTARSSARSSPRRRRA